MNEGIYLDAVGVIGREMYRFSSADPRYTSNLLGSRLSTIQISILPIHGQRAIAQ